jgi:hypothetical protein
MSSTEIETRYFEGMVTNKAFGPAIQTLIDKKLYTEPLSNESSDAFKSIGIYENANGTPNKAVALDVIVDSVTRSVFEQLKTSTPILDGSSNIGFSYTGTTDLNVALNSCSTVLEAIVLLATELSVMKIALQSASGGSFQSVANPAATISAKAASKLKQMIVE